METRKELIQTGLTAVEQGDWQAVYTALHSILCHLPAFAWMEGGDEWSEEDLQSACHEIGEAIFAKAGFETMQDIWYRIDDSMSGMGSKPLERYWDGCGNGAWTA